MGLLATQTQQEPTKGCLQLDALLFDVFYAEDATMHNVVVFTGDTRVSCRGVERAVVDATSQRSKINCIT